MLNEKIDSIENRYFPYVEENYSSYNKMKCVSNESRITVFALRNRSSAEDAGLIQQQQK